MNPLAATDLVVLLIGQGGREHALALSLARSPRVARILCAPGNAGTAAMGPLVRNLEVSSTDFDGLLLALDSERVDLAIVGPAEPVTLGLVDLLRARGIPTFGPTAAQAVLEGSKAFSKAFMQRHGIPTARYATFTDAPAARAYLDAEWSPRGIVVKMDGLAEVQSTLVTTDKAEALAEIERALVEDKYGEAGRRILIEERLVGPEVSLLAFVDGVSYQLLSPAQDHKQRDDHGQGPNTEGMGAYAPAPLVDATLLATLREQVLDATCRGLAAEGIGYSGVLFAGVLLDAAGPRVLEYNCRFGDPETQVVLPGLTTDLVDVIEASLLGTLATCPLAFDGASYVSVVATDPGYPDAHAAGAAITGLEAAAAVPGVAVVHARTRLEAGLPVVDGGRVINLVAGHARLERARQAAYEAAGHIRLNGRPAHYRRDIAGIAAVALDARRGQR